MNDDDRPDPHLRAALRHAPDADLQAPAELSARILAAARAAVAAERPPWWRRWITLPPLQLGASGAFATLAIAGVIGLLWHGQLPEPMPSQQADLPPPAAAVEITPAPPGASLPQPSPAPGRTHTRPVQPPQAPAAAEQRAKAALLRDEAKQRAKEPDAQAAAAAAARAEAAAAAAVPADAAAPAAGVVSVQPAAARAPAAAPAPPGAPPGAFAKPAPAEKAAAQRELPSRLAESGVAPVITNAASPTTWRIDGAEATPADPRWLRELERIAGLRWRSSDPPSATTEGRRVEFGEGEQATRIVLGAAQVLRCEGNAAAPRCRSAELSAEEARALAAALR